MYKTFNVFLSYCKTLSDCDICSNSEKIDPYYKNFCPDLFIYDNCIKAFSKILVR